MRIELEAAIVAWADRTLEAIRPYVRSRRELVSPYQQVLRRAHIPAGYDRYLAAAIRDGLVAVPVVGIVTVGVGVLAISGGLSGIGLEVSPIGFPWAVAIALVSAVVAATVAFVAIVGSRILGPYVRIRQRERRINGLLPYGMILMYSLARGGMSFQRVTDILAESRSTYGELAVEFERVRSDTTTFGMTQLAALEAAQERSPSERFAAFLDDLSSVVASGTDFQDFMAIQTNRQIARMRRDQEDLLQTLETFAQTYFVVVFVAPLFALVLLVLLSFIGADTIPVIQLLIYVDLPLATLGAVVLAGRLEGARTAPNQLPVASLDGGDRDPEPPDDEMVASYRRSKRWQSFRRRLSQPLEQALRRPSLTLLVAVPSALVLGAIVVWRLGIALSYSYYAANPIHTTAVATVILMLPVVPVAAFHELKRSRERTLVSEYPSALEAIAETNEIGIDLVESFDAVSRRLDGPIPEELGHVYGDIQLTGDVETALADLTGRVRNPEIRLSTKVLLEGYRSTGDLSDVLETLAEALEDRHALARDRRRAMRLYVFILVLGVLTFLAIVFFLDTFFFPPLTRVSSQLATVEAEQQFLGPSDIPIVRYRTLLFHAAIIQAVGNGLLMGKLIDDRALSGLKYAIGLTTVTIVVFLVL